MSVVSASCPRYPRPSLIEHLLIRPIGGRKMRPERVTSGAVSGEDAIRADRADIGTSTASRLVRRGRQNELDTDSTEGTE